MGGFQTPLCMKRLTTLSTNLNKPHLKLGSINAAWLLIYYFDDCQNNEFIRLINILLFRVGKFVKLFSSWMIYFWLRLIKTTFLFTAMWMTNRMDTDDINSLCWSSGESKTQIVTRSKVNCNKLNNNNCRRVQYQEYPSFIQDFELTDSSSVSSPW